MAKVQALPQADRRLEEIRLGIPCPTCNQMHTIKRTPGPTGRVQGNRCQGHRSSQVKVQCNGSAMKGTLLCRRHSGNGERNRAKGQAIMLEALDEVMVELVRLATEAEKDADKLRAIENLLDRNGYPRKTQYALEDARDLLSARLDEALPPEEEVLELTVLDDGA